MSTWPAPGGAQVRVEGSPCSFAFALRARRSKGRRVGELLILGVLWLVALPVWGAGIAAPVVGGSDAGNLRARAAQVWWNPAAMALAEGAQLSVSGHLVVGRIAHERERRALYQEADGFVFALPVPEDAVDPTRSGWAPPAVATPLALSPALFYMAPVGAGAWRWGAGLHTPYAALASYPAMGAQRYAVREATLLTGYGTVAIAYAPSPRWSVGAGVSGVVGFAELSRVQDFAALVDVGQALANPPIAQPNALGPDAPPALRELDVLSRPLSFHRGIATALTFHAGVQAAVTRDLRVGTTYHHGAPLNFRGRFRLNLDDPFFTRDLASQGLQYPALVTGDASLSMALPAQLRQTAMWALGQGWSLDAELAWVRWSAVRAYDVRARSPALAQPEVGLGETTRVRIERGWRDGWQGELGVHRELPGAQRWHVGVGWHQGVVPTATMDAASPDGPRVVLRGGVSLPVGEGQRVIVDGVLQQVLPQRVRDSRYDLANGRYALTLAAIGGGWEWSW